jgi:putative SOS response-associated peptidase YedK
MCGRYTLFETKDPVIFDDEEMGRIAEPMQWGFTPFWSKDPSKGPRPINTKSETAFESKLWLPSMRHHRCIVPARGFYE